MTTHKMTLEGGMIPKSELGGPSTATPEWTPFNKGRIWPEQRIGDQMEPGDVECYGGKRMHVCCTCGTRIVVLVRMTGFTRCPDCRREYQVYHMLEMREPECQ